MQQSNTPPDEDVVDVICREGSNGLARVLKNAGFASRDEVDSAIETRARQIATEQELTTKYPELKDHSSGFFRETAKHYASLTREGVPKGVAMKLAAQQAELAGVDPGRRPPTGAASKPGAKHNGPDEPEDLDEFQRYICEAMEVDPEVYKKRAKDGVRVGSR